MYKIKVPISLFFISYTKSIVIYELRIQKNKENFRIYVCFLSKIVRNLSFERATGNWYLWRSSSKTLFAVISVLQGKTWQST